MPSFTSFALIKTLYLSRRPFIRSATSDAPVNTRKSSASPNMERISIETINVLPLDTRHWEAGGVNAGQKLPYHSAAHTRQNLGTDKTMVIFLKKHVNLEC